MCRLRRAVLMRVVDDDLRSFVGHVALSFTLEKRMSLVRKIYIDSRTCSGNLADFTAVLPEPMTRSFEPVSSNVPLVVA